MSIDIYSILSSIPHNPHYLKRYINFIKGCKHKNGDMVCYVEHHHICPKSLFPEYKNLSEYSWNGVILTARQHFISHWILWKTFPKSNIKYAFWLMCNIKRTKQKISSKNYEKIKICISKNMSGKNNPMYENGIKGEGHYRFGTHHTEETKRKISKSNKGKKPTAETRRKLKENHYDCSGENNPMFGKQHTEETKRKISDSKRGQGLGIPKSEETKRKMSESSYLLEKKLCPYCKKLFAPGPYSRYHGEKCKFKNS